LASYSSNGAGAIGCSHISQSSVGEPAHDGAVGIDRRSVPGARLLVGVRWPRVRAADPRTCELASLPQGRAMSRPCATTPVIENCEPNSALGRNRSSSMAADSDGGGKFRLLGRVQTRRRFDSGDRAARHAGPHDRQRNSNHRSGRTGIANGLRRQSANFH
jgi:hypothetical protein